MSDGLLPSRPRVAGVRNRSKFRRGGHEARWLNLTHNCHPVRCRVAGISAATFLALAAVLLSLRPDSELLDNRPPFGGIGLLHGGKCLGRLAFARKNSHSALGKARLQCPIGQHLYGRRIEPIDDASWRKSPYQAVNESAASPISAKVGISGASAQRVLLVTA
jgi:hypothetical protein